MAIHESILSQFSVMHIASDISKSLAKVTVAGKVNGKLVDACDVY